MFEIENLMSDSLASELVVYPLAIVIVCPLMVQVRLVLIFPMPKHEVEVLMVISAGTTIFSFPFWGIGLLVRMLKLKVDKV